MGNVIPADTSGSIGGTSRSDAKSGAYTSDNESHTACSRNIYGCNSGNSDIHTSFLPIVKSFGMNSVQFGLILVYNLCIGNITPPVGNTLFVAIRVGGSTLARTLPYMLLYYVAILLGLLLVTYIPALTMALPALAGLI